jgi:2-isopropylmalate synthase
VRAGAGHVQGTINGYGERCGNANLISIAANLELKLGRACLGEGALPMLAALSRFVAEVANRTPDSHQPFVGSSAFAHKGGMHVSAVSRAPDSYEHIAPEQVGNQRRVLVSDLSGRANILYKARQFGLEIDAADERQKHAVAAVLERLKELESQGYQFEGAEASFELLVRRELGTAPRYFELHSFRDVTERRRGEEEASSEAIVEVSVGGVRRRTAFEARGPVAALDGALRQALEPFYPTLAELHLSDYKVRVLPALDLPQGEGPAPVGTASVVRVLVESGDGNQSWGTVGVSQSILEASYRALCDSIEYKLLKDGISSPPA